MANRTYGQTFAQMQRAAERAERDRQRAAVAAAKEAQRQYVASRATQVEWENRELEESVFALGKLLTYALSVDSQLDFESLKPQRVLEPFDPGDLAQEEPAPRESDFLPLPPSGLRKLAPGAKKNHIRDCEAGQEAFDRATLEHAECEASRRQKLETVRERHQAYIEESDRRITRQHEETDAFRAGFEGGQPEAIVGYFSLVLEKTAYPEGFPQRCRMAFVPESKQLVVEYDLPPLEVVPSVGTYRYVKSGDKVTQTARPVGAQRALYASVVAQVALRTIHEIFEADRGRHLESVVFNGHVDTIDKGTGFPVRPCLVTVRTTIDPFSQLDLAKVEPVACLKALNASFSKSPAELAPVRPVLEFNMVDPRYVEESDVLSGLDQRPNLMELTPNEFESLITNLFEKMGLETRQTQASRDGGVDCVAYNPRPIFGGKVVIQAKRYKNTVGVSAVRDLFGTMQNEGASKGILVTTSGYGKASFQFAEGKPLELLSGSNLLFLLAEHAGIEAKIEPPDDWKDPEPDS